jgi:hypothetical protein
LPDGHPLAKRNGETPFYEGMPSEAQIEEIDAFFDDID